VLLIRARRFWRVSPPLNKAGQGAWQPISRRAGQRDVAGDSMTTGKKARSRLHQAKSNVQAEGDAAKTRHP